MCTLTAHARFSCVRRETGGSTASRSHSSRYFPTVCEPETSVVGGLTLLAPTPGLGEGVNFSSRW